MLVVGSDLLERSDGSALLASAMKVASSADQAPPTEDWRVLNVLQKVCVLLCQLCRCMWLYCCSFGFVCVLVCESGGSDGCWLYSRSIS